MTTPPPGGFSDPFEPIKKMWASLGVPIPGMSSNFGSSMMFPTTDINEIEKRISDLRSVETWLSLNLEIVRTTVQGLEAQRSTLSAFQAMQSQMSQAVSAAAESQAAASAASVATAAASAGASDKRPRRRKGAAR